MSPGGNILPSGSKTSGPAERKVEGTGSKHFAHGSLGIIVNGTTSICTPGFLDLRILAIGEIAPYIGCCPGHIQPSGEPCSSPARYCHLAAL